MSIWQAVPEASKLGIGELGSWRLCLWSLRLSQWQTVWLVWVSVWDCLSCHESVTLAHWLTQWVSQVSHPPSVSLSVTVAGTYAESGPSQFEKWSKCSRINDPILIFFWRQTFFFIRGQSLPTNLTFLVFRFIVVIHWQTGVNGIAKVPKRSFPKLDSNPAGTVRSPVQANALTHLGHFGQDPFSARKNIHGRFGQKHVMMDVSAKKI